MGSPQYQSQLQEIAASYDSLCFNKHLEFRQGAYLTIAPPGLIAIWDEIYAKKSGTHLPLVDTSLFSTMTTTAPGHALAGVQPSDKGATSEEVSSLQETGSSAPLFSEKTFQLLALLRG